MLCCCQTGCLKNNYNVTNVYLLKEKQMRQFDIHFLKKIIVLSNPNSIKHNF